MKIYTKQGDSGMTSLADGTKLAKSGLRLDTYGTVDELNSHLGVLIALLARENGFTADIELLKKTQNGLFNLGSQLACVDKKIAAKLPNISSAQIEIFEKAIDQMDAQLAPLRNFILPGGHLASAQAHICRTVCRRAERLCVALNESTPLDYPAIQYLNRLSDYFFTLARWINHKLGVPTEEWTSKL